VFIGALSVRLGEKNFSPPYSGKMKEKKVVGKFFLKASISRYLEKHQKYQIVKKNWPIFTFTSHGDRLTRLKKNRRQPFLDKYLCDRKKKTRGP